MERLQDETIEQFETRLWAEHAAQPSDARAATSVAFYIENGVATGGAVVSSWSPLPENFVSWADYRENNLPKNFSVSDCETAFFNNCPNMGAVCEETCRNCPEFRLRSRGEA